MYTFLRIRQLWIHVRKFLAVEFGKTDETIFIERYNIALEQKYDLGDHAKSLDAVYFNGMSQNGEAVVCGLARRPQRMCDSFLYLKINGEDLLLSPSLPDTYLQKGEEDGDEYSVKGLSISNVMPMRVWNLSYVGDMKPRSNPNKTVKISASLTWSAEWPQFEYNTQMAPQSMADDMAREPWSRDYFRLVKKLHQTHYEQMGCLTGTVDIDSKTYRIDMQCLRDRSFGPLREWRNFHRYVYHFIFLENGDCMAVGSVSQPATMSHLTIGYLCRKADQSVVAVDSSDYQLYQHAENRILPKDYGFTFKAGEKSYEVRVQLIDEDQFYIGKDREAKLYERWSNVEINGVKGKACVEWHFNNTQK
ncbi:unnamed protein product, partial [Brenthis ino]